MVYILFWIIGITAITLFGSWYARKFNRPDALIGLYVAFVLFANIAASKIAEFDLGFETFYAPAAVIIFSVTFLMTDIVNEKFGRKETHKMIMIAFATQVALAFFSWLVVSLNPAPFWSGQESYALILGQVPRLILASWIAFLISENLDAVIFAWFKKLTKGNHLWMRNAFSSLPAMALDSIIFVAIAFYGQQPIWPVILGLIVVKWVIGVIDIPFMYLNRWVMYWRKG
ncbi:queuosine precursor transporter [Candidatus Saccharibacteria bacterium]|nr:queuosine precursor transporter [Candidatus Saccharibacteria bacterium]NIV03194.1 queuosine precursor transporter [Calditrichia bacterium]NIS37700.1 queuosine precursor transporter [Candidatus Saccharibacteria bacterium]NIV71306.1 queuosine precursor transporter [Calditrichia bacterium]NIV97794.1 queuosine precursor transporter [Candidatus Saccharibacteria bacterium]